MDEVQSRSVQRRVAVQKGEPMPTFSKPGLEPDHPVECTDERCGTGKGQEFHLIVLRCDGADMTEAETTEVFGDVVGLLDERGYGVNGGGKSFDPNEEEVVSDYADLKQAVLEFIAEMDKVMPQPSTYEKGRAIARLIGELQEAAGIPLAQNNGLREGPADDQDKGIHATEGTAR